MVRNIPTRFTSITLIDVLKEYGFDKTFDFIYLPMDFKTKKNCGYAFMNFVNPEYARQFMKTFQGLQLKAATSQKLLDIIPSRRQGFIENISVFESSDLLSSAPTNNQSSFFKPLVLKDGDLIPLNETVYSEFVTYMPKDPQVSSPTIIA
jgi:RNA recognition motif-containing protein